MSSTKSIFLIDLYTHKRDQCFYQHKIWNSKQKSFQYRPKLFVNIVLYLAWNIKSFLFVFNPFFNIKFCMKNKSTFVKLTFLHVTAQMQQRVHSRFYLFSKIIFMLFMLIVSAYVEQTGFDIPDFLNRILLILKPFEGILVPFDSNTFHIEIYALFFIIMYECSYNCKGGSWAARQSCKHRKA